MTESEARELFGLSAYANRTQGYNRYRYLLKKNHPDKGGSTELCQTIIAAWGVLKDILTNGLRVVTLQEYVTDNGQRVFYRFCQEREEPDGTRFSGTSFTYIRTCSNVYEWNRISEEFYPRLSEEDKVLRDGKNCEVILLRDDEIPPKWAEWTVPYK